VNDELACAVAGAMARPEALSALRGVYEALAGDPAAGESTCLGGGACCRFDLAGHRLYASTLELAGLWQETMVDPSRAPRRRCPFQRGPRCTARAWRPLGCRTHFCGAGAERIAAIHEPLHARIRELHRTFGLEYRYVEVTAGLVRLMKNLPGPRGNALTAPPGGSSMQGILHP
jgi:Fe-S-cluster containining protein